MSSYFAKLSLAAITSLGLLFTSSSLSAQDVTIKVENGTAKTITINPTGGDKEDADKDDDSKKPFTGKRAAVDVAILLDTSNSMDGLIGQAQAQLWGIVQEFSKAEKAGQTPLLRVAVFEYGNSRLPASEGYIRQVEQLTTDMDRISEVLFELTTKGGDEYCGQVIDECLTRLDWSDEPNSYKAIFIAGNEPFTQGSVGYEKVCKKAIESGVVVNTIHCGNYNTGVSGKWQHAAELTEGKYLNINQDHRTVHIECPQDKIIIELNSKLNKTYLWYGAKQARSKYAGNQLAQDGNAAKPTSQAFGGGIISRTAAKSSSSYNNKGRDLVDSFAGDAEGLKKLDKAVLPEAMQKMTEAERVAHLEKMTKERAELKAKIAKLNKERLAHIAAERKKMAASGKAEKTLSDVMNESVRLQLEKSGFELKE